MAKWHYIDKNGNVSENTFGKNELRALLKAGTVLRKTRVVPEGNKNAGTIGGTIGGVGGAAAGGIAGAATIPSVIAAHAAAGTAGAAATSSGLAALGGGSLAVGGAGVAGGMAVVAALPIVAAVGGAALLGFGGYKLAKKWAKSSQDAKNQVNNLTVSDILGIE